MFGNATSELEQPGQRRRKREKNKSNKFNYKENRNSEREVADVLADLFAVIAQITLTNLIGMAMQSSLKYLGSSFHEQRSLRL